MLEWRRAQWEEKNMVLDVVAIGVRGDQASGGVKTLPRCMDIIIATTGKRTEKIQAYKDTPELAPEL